MDQKSNKKKITLINKNFTLIYILILFIIVFAIVGKGFFSLNNLNSVLISQATVGFMAIGAMLILIIDEFDLSLGYQIGFIMVIGAWLSMNNCNVIIVTLAMLATGTICGFLNGILTIKLNISSFISTLIIGTCLLGLSQGITGGAVFSKNIPKAFTYIGQDKWASIGVCVWILIAVLVIMLFIMEHTKFGRHFYAVGGNTKVAFMAGVKTGRVKMLAFTLAGFFTSIAAIIQLGQSGSAFPSFGSSLLMPAYAIAFLSAAAFKSGTYNVGGLMVAILVMGIGRNGLNIAGAPWWAEYLYNGSVLVFAIFLANMERGRRRAKFKKVVVQK